MKRTKKGKVPEFEYEFEYPVKIDSMEGRDKVIKRIERIIRSSMEYRALMFFLKENIKIYQPFTLYNLVNIFICKWEETGRPLDEFRIADEIMEYLVIRSYRYI